MSDTAQTLTTQWTRSPTEEARYWRRRANEVRKVMAIFDDPEARAKLDEIAGQYDKMADDLGSLRESDAFAAAGRY